MNMTPEQQAIEAAWRAAAAACVKDGNYTAPVTPEDWEAALRPALAAALELLATKPVAYGRLRDGRLVGLGYDRDDDADMTVPLGIIGSLSPPAGPPPLDRSEELELVMDVCRTTVIAGNEVPMHQVRRLQEFYAKAGAAAQADELEGMFTAAADPKNRLSLPRLVRSDASAEVPSANVVGLMVSALRNVHEHGSSTVAGECGGCQYTCCGADADDPSFDKHASDCFAVEASAALASYDAEHAAAAQSTKDSTIT